MPNLKTKMRDMPYKDPIKQREYFRQYRAKWILKNADKLVKWRLENKEKIAASMRERAYKRLYGITVADYDRMLANQGGGCGICQTTESKGRGRFHVDHDHKTGKVRGILCHSCNTALGRVERYDMLNTYLNKGDLV